MINKGCLYRLVHLNYKDSIIKAVQKLLLFIEVFVASSKRIEVWNVLPLSPPDKALGLGGTAGFSDLEINKDIIYMLVYKSISLLAYTSISLLVYKSISLLAYKSIRLLAYKSISLLVYKSISVLAYKSISLLAYKSISLLA